MKTFTFLAALALVAGTVQAQSAGLIILANNGSGALSMSGQAAVAVPAVYVNSNNSTAVTAVGNAVLNTPYLYIRGGTSFAGGTGCSGQVSHIAAPVADPLSSTVFQSTTGMTNLGTLTKNGGTNYINPGYWAGGASFSGNALVSMSPGVYIFGGNVTVSSGCTVNGSGVTIVIMSGALSFAGQSNVNLTPPNSGNYNGIVIAQRSSDTSPMSLSGGSALHVSGAIYCPGAALTISGQGTAQAGPHMGDLIVCKTAVLSGQGVVQLGDQSLAAVQPPHQPLAD